jgi:hypothetical protein
LFYLNYFEDYRKIFKGVPPSIGYPLAIRLIPANVKNPAAAPRI